MATTKKKPNNRKPTPRQQALLDRVKAGATVERRVSTKTSGRGRGFSMSNVIEYRIKEPGKKSEKIPADLAEGLQRRGLLSIQENRKGDDLGRMMPAIRDGDAGRVNEILSEVAEKNGHA